MYSLYSRTGQPQGGNVPRPGHEFGMFMAGGSKIMVCPQLCFGNHTLAKWTPSFTSDSQLLFLTLRSTSPSMTKSDSQLQALIVQCCHAPEQSPRNRCHFVIWFDHPLFRDDDFMQRGVGNYKHIPIILHNHLGENSILRSIQLSNFQSIFRIQVFFLDVQQ